jgi:hypothetical protein
MSNDAHDRATSDSRSTASTGPTRRLRHKWLLVLLCVLILLAGFLVPPLVNVGRYKKRITQLMSISFGRPVRLSSVELRLLPWPGFVLTDLSVAEDPAYGSEPVLHANTVTANIRLQSLWRGRLEISSVSVDEASLNVVRTGSGRWNLAPLFRTAAAQPGSPLHARSLPYLEATNSRVNFKNGAEKLPFSLMNTDLSFWQESPNQWRIRLRGQPARTDVNLDLADTGIVRLEASLGRAAALHQMPLHADLDWREAQLGQLSRLLMGSDKGWRGDLTGELHLDGTPEEARVTTRLRATNVHRAEFVPLSALDFDANCGFVYHYGYGRTALNHVGCNSPLGSGRLRLSGEVPGGGAAPQLAAELDQIPVEAGLDALRTLRSGIDPSLEAGGSISGRLVYGSAESPPEPVHPNARGRRESPPANSHGPLSGTLTVDGFALTGGSLGTPLRATKFELQPSSEPDRDDPERLLLAGTASFPAGGSAPLDTDFQIALDGYHAEIRGETSIARARQIEETAGIGAGLIADGLAGEPLVVNLKASGPWLVPEEFSASAAGSADSAPDSGNADSMDGTVTLHEADWHADFLANPVQIAQATLHVTGGGLRWDPVDFTYGPVKARASITLPQSCLLPKSAPGAQAPCIPQFEVQVGSLDAATVQAAFLGAHQKGTLLSDLLDRLHPATAPPWPKMEGVIHADALEVGPVTLRQASTTVEVSGSSAEFSDLQASLLGGKLDAHGVLRWAADGQEQPAYSLEGKCTDISASALGRLFGGRWSGGPLDASGRASLTGFTGKQLAQSAKGTLRFDWAHGAMAADVANEVPAARPASGALPRSAPARFDRWSGEAQIADGRVKLGKNQLVAGGQKKSIEGEITLGKPPKAHFNPAK